MVQTLGPVGVLRACACGARAGRVLLRDDRRARGVEEAVPDRQLSGPRAHATRARSRRARAQLVLRARLLLFLPRASRPSDRRAITDRSQQALARRTRGRSADVRRVGREQQRRHDDGLVVDAGQGRRRAGNHGVARAARGPMVLVLREELRGGLGHALAQRVGAGLAGRRLLLAACRASSSALRVHALVPARLAVRAAAGREVDVVVLQRLLLDLWDKPPSRQSSSTECVCAAPLLGPACPSRRQLRRLAGAGRGRVDQASCSSTQPAARRRNARTFAMLSAGRTGLAAGICAADEGERGVPLGVRASSAQAWAQCSSP